MTQAWCNGKELQVIEGDGRIITADGETVVISSCFPDGTKFVIAIKTFPPGTLAAARRRWKQQNYTRHYGMDWGQFNAQWQGASQMHQDQQQQAYDAAAQAGATNAYNQKQYASDFDSFVSEVLGQKLDASQKNLLDILMGKKPRR